MKKHLQFNRNRRLGLADVWVLAALVTATLVLTGRAAWHTWGADSHQSEAIPGAVEHSAGSGVSIFYEPIETIRVGQKVWSDGNPTGDLDERFGDEVDSHTWRKMVLRAPKRDGSVAEVEMLRPGWWLGERDVFVGGRVDIEVPECGIEGLAQVLAVGPCPDIAPGPGRVVTATFHHQSTHTLDLRLEGVAEPIGCTANHPIWSEAKQEFVRADQLTSGEAVRTLHGITRVVSVTDRGRPEPVYNIEVQVDHTYHVSVAGLLVHNGGPTLPILNPCFRPSNEARRNFGIAVHQEFPEGINRQYPGSQFESRVGPGQRGPDAPWSPNSKYPGFRTAELKPDTSSGLARYGEQLSNWEQQGIQGPHALFKYNPATGKIDFDNPTIFH